ncbi:MAG: NAD(P)/FAD-dependent oxidoreductase [Hyphomicrobiales bacterium]
MSEHVVIVGAGHAAGQLAQSLRMDGFEGNITIVGDEPYAPYQRPPLSKGLISGNETLDDLYLRDPNGYGEIGVELVLNTAVTAINRAAKTVTFSSDDTLSYDKLVLATGTRVRELPLPGADLENVFYLRTLDHSQAIQDVMAPGRKLSVIGGGFIGLEMAASAAKLGLDVTVLEAADRLMGRAVSHEISNFYKDHHQDQGVAVHTGIGITHLSGDGSVEAVALADGNQVAADIVVIGIGVLPNSEVAEEAGLDVENGIVVDEFCKTNDPDIFAIGDCTNHPNPAAGRNIRLESVQNAVDQARTVSGVMCGKQAPYAALPWFWSDQFELRLQIAGLIFDTQKTVTRPSDEETSFSVFHYGDNGIIACEAVNAPKDFMAAKMMIAKNVNPDPERLGDPEVPIRDLMRGN